MKQFLLCLFAAFSLFTAGAQTILSENFSTVPAGSDPPNWQLSSNTDVHNYERPYECIADKGLETPAVGHTAPARMILPTLSWDATNNIIQVRFKVFVFDANVSCNSVKDFPCTTYVRVMLVKASYAGGTNNLPTAGDIYAEQTYRIAIANGDNTIIFNHPTIPNGADYKVYFDFKTADNSNCTGAGTRFIFDDFVITKSTCPGTCAPVANDDYFEAGLQGFINTVKANVYGGYLLWASEGRAGYEMKSLSIPPAVNDGLDYDADNHALSAMQFILTSQPVVEASEGCTAPAPAGTLTWFGDGSFEYTRGDVCVMRVQFKYLVIDPNNLRSDTAMVVMDFPPNAPLPVNFHSFSAERMGVNVVLKWQTSLEKDCQGFFVQRNTGNGWTDQAFLASAAVNGNSSSLNAYQFTDVNNFAGTTQYRIAEQDIDGSMSYSMIKLVGSEQQAGRLVVFPNPAANGSVNVLFPAGSSNHSVVLFDMKGRMLKEWRLVSGNSLTITNLLPGMYMLKVYDQSNLRMHAKIVIVE